MKKQNGFTLIELMIVVAIIAILAAIALPAYQDYLARSQVSEGLSLASGAKTAVAETYANTGAFPANNAAAGLETAANIKGKYITSVTVSSGGVITALFNSSNAKLSGKNLVLTPTDNNGSISWGCSTGTTIDQKYLPTSCRTAATP
ncbi:fimbrial protein [Xanthomonas citri pv. fuscans]|uniref:Fimbrial protein n=4 Tax=Xanthomonas citri TaxID=346 RepID=A0AB34Q3K1_XANCI|nr:MULTISPECIES: pilin [Xanthomonas]AMU97582.1 fimbrial protein [Xanthomonas citri pv. aurantifolii]AMV02334.1 fimbrial protein [Xanthomonas citri pv. aurantifolii]ATB59263.1 putative Tfp pilus assembly protein major pilin PilA [Xanthomonas citri pv. fuscans]ATS64241.1 pilin [Xanthomonas citri pv. phaseoli var. fuscans]ATS68185.1 pilin [Xanthomonas citri pv. phaseoli var. fuscans]